MRISYAIILAAIAVFEGCKPKDADTGKKDNENAQGELEQEDEDEEEEETEETNGDDKNKQNNLAPDSKVIKKFQDELKAAKADVDAKKAALDAAQQAVVKNTADIATAQADLAAAVAAETQAREALDRAKAALNDKRGALVAHVADMQVPEITESAQAFKTAVTDFARPAGLSAESVANLRRLSAAVVSPLWTDAIRDTCGEFITAIETEIAAPGLVAQARTVFLNAIRDAAPVQYSLPDAVLNPAIEYQAHDDQARRDALIGAINALPALSRQAGAVYHGIDQAKDPLVAAIAGLGGVQNEDAAKGVFRAVMADGAGQGNIPDAVWNIWAPIAGNDAAPLGDLLAGIQAVQTEVAEGRAAALDNRMEAVANAADVYRQLLRHNQGLRDTAANRRRELLDAILNPPNPITREIVTAARSLRDEPDNHEAQTDLLGLTNALPEGNAVKVAGTQLEAAIAAPARLLVDTDAKKDRCIDALGALTPARDALDLAIIAYDAAVSVDDVTTEVMTSASDNLITAIEGLAEPVRNRIQPPTQWTEFVSARTNVRTQTGLFDTATAEKGRKQAALTALTDATAGLKAQETDADKKHKAAVAKVGEVEKKNPKKPTTV